MTTMSSLEAKNAFGQFLDAAQRAPVTVTKNGRDVGAMFCRADLEAMADVWLSPGLQAAVRDKELTISEALLRQAAQNRRLTEAEADVAAGRVHVADDAFFDGMRAHVRSVAARR